MSLARPHRDLHLQGDRHYAAGRYEAALSAFEAAARADPGNAPLHFNIGATLRMLNRSAEARAAHERAIAIRPDFAMAQHNRALAMLQMGDLAEGFRAYEWRKACPTFDDPRYADPRQWGGEDIAGKSLFIYPELFLGDLIQFSRYALVAAQRGAKVRLAAPEAMHALLRTLGPQVAIVADGEVPADVDVCSALMSLPAVFATTLETIPWAPAYLRPDAMRVERWRRRIGEAGFKVGVVWQGSTAAHARPLQRSFPLAALAGLAAIPQVRLISLQKQEGLDQLAGLPPEMAVETLGDGFDPGPDLFVDTAAAMACCDLVITPDTSTAHLAGALGVAAWVALPFVSDWRWPEGWRQSPWYPSLRLFRQEARGDWTGVFAAMESELRQRLA